MSQNRSRLILGIDPGTEKTGFGIIALTGTDLQLVDYGCIATKKSVAADQRLLEIEKDLQTLLNKHKPDLLAIEKLFFTKNVTSALAVGQARGVVLLSCAKKKMPIFEYNPMQVKMALTGYGAASKEQVEKMVQKILKLDFIPQPDDVSDALAVAICHAHNTPLLNALSQNKQ